MKTDGAAVAGRVYMIMACAYGRWSRRRGFPARAAGPGFVGAAVSFGNAWWMHRIAMSIGAEGRNPRRIHFRGTSVLHHVGRSVCYSRVFLNPASWPLWPVVSFT